MSAGNFSKRIRNIYVVAGLTAILATVLFVVGGNVSSAQRRSKPITKAALIEGAAVSAKLRMGTSELLRIVRRKGVNFRLTPQVESELRAAKLRPEVISAVRENYRGAATVASANPPRRNNSAGGSMMANTVTKNTSTTNNVAGSGGSGDDLEEGDDVEERYDALYKQALDTMYRVLTPGMDQQRAGGFVKQARDLAREAILLDDTRPDGYKIYAATAFLMQDYALAERNCYNVIDRGGFVQFNILHFHGNQPITEMLYISDESVSIEYDGGYNVFKYSEIVSAQTKGSIPFGQGTAAVFSMNVNRNGERFETFFIPSFRGTAQDAQLITKIINRNLEKYR